MSQAKKPPEEPGAKERIFQTAIELFSRKGYAATGVRELAREAGVNLATINYFYGSKQGLMEAVIDYFFSQYIEVIKEALAGDDEPEVKVERLIIAATTFFEKNHRQALIGISNLYLDSEEMTSFKAKHVSRMLEILTRGVAEPLEAKLGRRVPLNLIGPAMVSLMLSHYLFKPVAEKVLDRYSDEEFYRRYPENIARIFMHGVLSFLSDKTEEEV